LRFCVFRKNRNHHFRCRVVCEINAGLLGTRSLCLCLLGGLWAPLGANWRPKAAALTPFWGPLGSFWGCLGFFGPWCGPLPSLCVRSVSPGRPLPGGSVGPLLGAAIRLPLLLGRGDFAVPVLVAWPLGWGGASPCPSRGCRPSSWGFALSSGRMPLSSSNLYFFFCYSSGDARQYYLKTVSQVLFP